MTAATPPIRRRIVGGALRRYREALGYTLDDAARVLECDRSKVSRIETGERGVRAGELREMLTEYGASKEVQAALAAVTDPKKARGWREAFGGVLPEALQDRFALEAAASRVLVYEAQRVPEILQTPQYARALAEADPALRDDDARERAVAATLALQKTALGDGQADVHVIIGEAALRQRAGDATVMEGQLGLLAGVSGDSGRVTVQVLPFGGGTHPAPWAGSLTLLEFGEDGELRVIWLGSALRGVCLDGAAEVAAYGKVFDRLRGLALPPARSALALRGLKAA